MHCLKNDRGAVLVFITLMIVVLLIMVGMGLDTGQLAYVRSQGQLAVDAAALAAASAVPTGNPAEVDSRVAAFNATHDYVKSGTNPLGPPNITYISYNDSTGAITKEPGVSTANGVRVSLEAINPYGGTGATAINSPLFLTPLFNLFGASMPATANISVSAVAVVRAIPGFPVAIEEGMCDQTDPAKTKADVVLLQSPSVKDTSGFTSFLVQNASSDVMKAMVNNNKTCGAIPPVTIGTCTQLNNGQVNSLLNEIKNLGPFQKPPTPDDCYLIPVVRNGASWNQCESIKDFARICISEVNTNGSPKYVVADVTCKQNLYTTRDTKCYVPTLVRDQKSGM